MSMKEVREEISANMKKWQKIENSSISSTGQIIEKTANPVIREIMEIIQADSARHFRIQGLIIDSLETKAVSLTPDELGDIWGMIEHHITLERKTVEFAEASLAALKGKKMPVQEYLLNYLLEDEKKHNELLDALSKIKEGMYPYSG